MIMSDCNQDENNAILQFNEVLCKLSQF